MLPRDAAGMAVRRLDYRPPAYLVEAVELTFALDPASTVVTASLAFRRNPAAPEGGGAPPPFVLDGEGQDELAVALDGVALAPELWTLTDTTLTLHAPPASGRLEIRSRINPAANTALEGLYVSSGVFCTQCEPEGFRRITYFPDRPDVLAVYTVTISADRSRYPVLLSNGNRVAAGELPGGRHFVRWHDPFPKPSYLFALVAGDIAALEDTYTTRSGRRVDLAIYSTPANLERCRHAMAALERAMRWDEERYGREYDLDTFMIYCADDFNLGAMENKGLNIFNSKLVLARPDTATDDDYQAIEGVIGHEYFHNWTGNRVTCRDWFQLSLKEGLTVFRDQEFSADGGSRAVERIAAVDFLRTHQFPEDAGPMAHPVRPDEYLEINNFYTKTVYEKGAELIRMQHTLLGPERFRRGMDLYFERHDGQAVTCDDFVQAMQDAAGDAGALDLSQFRRWYAQAGTPVLHVRGAWDPAARSYTLDVRQDCPPSPGQPHKAPFHIPLALGLVGPDGADLPLRLDGEAAAGPTTRVLQVTAAQHTFRFVDVPAAPVPSLLRGFSAPVKLDFDYGAADLALLAAHDSDAVNRWDAAQRCFCAAILGEAQRRASGAPPALDPALAAVVDHLLADDEDDPALIALALAPPSLAWLAEQVDAVDVDALCAAREFVIRELARMMRAALLRGVSSRPPPPDYAPVQAQIGPRALRNRCLHYLGALDDGAGARAGGRAVRRRRQHDRRRRRARRDQPQRRARARGAVRALRGEVARRAAGARQVVRAAGDLAAAGHARPRAGAVRAPEVQRPQSQSRALARRRVRHAQLAGLPRRGRQRLRVRHRADHGARPRQSARLVDACQRVQPMAAPHRAAARAAARRAGGNRPDDGALAGRARDRRPQSRRLTPGPRAA